MNYTISEDYFDFEHLIKTVPQKVKIELVKEEIIKIYLKEKNKKI